MSNTHPHLARHALAYFLLAFAISWGGILLVVGPAGLPGTAEDFERLLLPVVVAMLAGPSTAGIASSVLLHGRPGLQDLGRRLGRWRVGAQWYAMALLTAPLVVAATIFAFSSRSSVYLPGIVATPTPTAHLLTGLATGLAAGLFEEIGWTGFAIPELRRRFSVLATGLVVGVAWGAWHFLTTWWGSAESLGQVSAAVYFPVLLFSFLVPYRVLMVWVYERTESVPVAMLMHASLTASVRIFDPLSIAGMPLVSYNAAMGGLFWVVVIALFATSRSRRTS